MHACSCAEQPLPQVCKAWEAAVMRTVAELSPARVDPGFWQRMPGLERLHLEPGHAAVSRWSTRPPHLLTAEPAGARPANDRMATLHCT